MSDKLYFAKYLPVEGEIKKGDKCTHPSFNSLGVMEALTNNEGEKLKSSGGTKVKLMLCSRDNIQKGDKVQFQIVMDKTPWKELEVLEVDGNELQLKDGEFVIHTTIDNTYTIFKIIGEISPEVIWVTEKMEFSENEIEQKSEIYTWEDDYFEDAHIFKNFNAFVSKNKNYSYFIIKYRTKWKDAPDEVTFEVFYNEYKIKCPTCFKFH